MPPSGRGEGSGMFALPSAPTTAVPSVSCAAGSPSKASKVQVYSTVWAAPAPKGTSSPSWSLTWMEMSSASYSS